MAQKSRRAKGEGGVYQLGDGTWAAQVELAPGADGQRHRKYFYGPTAKSVAAKLRAFRALVPAATPVVTTPLADYLDGWLIQVRDTIEPRTYGGYESHVRLHLKPQVTGLTLETLTAPQVQGIYDRLRAAKVSANSVNKVGTTLAVAINEAVRHGRLLSSPVAVVKKPKASRAEIEVFTPEQVQILLGAVHGQMHPLVITGLDAGLRPQELLALQRSDVVLGPDWSGYLQITRALEFKGGGGKGRIKVLKTKGSRRRIDLTKPTVMALSIQLRVIQKHASAVLFPNSEHGYLHLSNLLNRAWQPLLVKAKLPRVGLYTLRHTCATLLLAAGVSPKVVAERLGHASVKITLDTYSHVLPGMQAQAAVALTGFLTLPGG